MFLALPIYHLTIPNTHLVKMAMIIRKTPRNQITINKDLRVVTNISVRSRQLSFILYQSFLCSSNIHKSILWSFFIIKLSKLTRVTTHLSTPQLDPQTLSNIITCFLNPYLEVATLSYQRFCEDTELRCYTKGKLFRLCVNQFHRYNKLPDSFAPEKSVPDLNTAQNWFKIVRRVQHSYRTSNSGNLLQAPSISLEHLCGALAILEWIHK